MKRKIFILTFIFIFLFSCLRKEEIEYLKEYPVNDLDGIITKTGVEFDQKISSDKNGSLKITAIDPTVFKLYETGNIDIENARLIYTAWIKTENLNGKVFLEMWCFFEGQGEYFSRNIHSFLSGTNEWLAMETVFFLKKGENPDNIKLNLVVEGTGIIWIDEIKLKKAKL